MMNNIFITSASWETYGLTFLILIFVAWKFWDTTANEEEREKPNKKGRKKKLFLNRCFFEWRHFLTDFARATLILVSLAVSVNIATRIFEAAGSVEVIEKEIVVVSKVPEVVTTKIVLKDVKVVKIRETLMSRVEKGLKKHPELKGNRADFASFLEVILKDHMGDWPENGDSSIIISFPQFPESPFTIKGNLEVIP